MTKIAMPMLRDLTFPDYGVRSFDYDAAARNLSILMDGAWLGVGTGRGVGAGRLVVDRWSTVEVRTFGSSASTWSIATLAEQLKDICEAEFDTGRVVLRGFSRASGFWTEFVFLGATTFYEVGQ